MGNTISSMLTFYIKGEYMTKNVLSIFLFSMFFLQDVLEPLKFSLSANDDPTISMW